MRMSEKPEGWSVPVLQCFFHPPTLGGVPAKVGMILGVATFYGAMYLSLWCIPLTLVFWVALACLFKYDPYILEIGHRFIHHARRYYGR